MKVEELTSQQRIEILEDVLKKLESGNSGFGLCKKIKSSAYKLFGIFDDPDKIFPLLTLENAKKVTEVKAEANKDYFWWDYGENFDFENRIKFVNWMINEEKSFLK